MNRRMQITISSQPPAGPPVLAPRLSFWQRFKLLLTGVGIAVIAVTILVAALVLGSILATLVGIILLILVVAIAIKVALKRARRRV